MRTYKLVIQSAFAKDVVNLVSSFEELSFKFKEVGEDLTALHTKDIMNEEVVRTVRTARQLGEQQFKAFLKERLEDETNLKTNNRPTDNARERKVVLKDKAKITVLKEDLFSRLYIVYQNRDGNLEDFLEFENQSRAAFTVADGRTPRRNQTEPCNESACQMPPAKQ